jgi:hypothetical protein
MKTSSKQKTRRTHQSQRFVAAKKGVKSKTQSGEARAHLDFLMRFKGSLPETLTESDIETLNAGLAFLFAWLRQARQEYDEESDGGRVAAFTALGAMWQFVALFNSSQAESLHLPALKLMEALAALDQNNVLPILKPVARPGRAPSSHAYASLQGHAAAAVMRLRQLKLDLKQAYMLVANELAKLGVRPERGKQAITADTIRHWCDVVESDVGRIGTAAMIYDEMFTPEENKRLYALPPAEAKRFTLSSMRSYVQKIFPELRTTAPKKPS